MVQRYKLREDIARYKRGAAYHDLPFIPHDFCKSSIFLAIFWFDAYALLQGVVLNFDVRGKKKCQCLSGRAQDGDKQKQEQEGSATSVFRNFVAISVRFCALQQQCVPRAETKCFLPRNKMFPRQKHFVPTFKTVGIDAWYDLFSRLIRFSITTDATNQTDATKQMLLISK